VQYFAYFVDFNNYPQQGVLLQAPKGNSDTDNVNQNASLAHRKRDGIQTIAVQASTFFSPL
jgi:hypothetical protein